MRCVGNQNGLGDIVSGPSSTVFCAPSSMYVLCTEPRPLLRIGQRPVGKAAPGRAHHGVADRRPMVDADRAEIAIARGTGLKSLFATGSAANRSDGSSRRRPGCPTADRWRSRARGRETPRAWPRRAPSRRTRTRTILRRRSAARAPRFTSRTSVQGSVPGGPASGSRR